LGKWGGNNLDFVIENIRLRELVAVVNENKAFFEDFINFLNDHGFNSVPEFINTEDDSKAQSTILAYLIHKSDAKLYDGLGNPYANGKARWYFLSWFLRDAPAQRLGPLVMHMPGNSPNERKARLLNELRKYVKPLFPETASWEWPALSEVLIARLEGSRRALKGTLFEAVVRRCLASVFDKHQIELRIGDKQIRVEDETYDVPVYGLEETLLIPVKTRETMGGGHALLFTRDIHKSVSVAEGAGFHCLPVVIAESWSGKLEDLACEHFVYIQANPNQITKIEPILLKELENLVDVFKTVS
jgi:hypothetical protein